MSKGHFMSNGPISYLSNSALRTLSSSTATTSLLKTSLAILRSLSWSILRVSWNARSCSFLISLSFSALQKKLAFLKSNLIETDLEIEKKITCPPSWASPPPAAFSPLPSPCSSMWPVFYFWHWILQDSLNGQITTNVSQMQHLDSKLEEDKDYHMKSLFASMFAGEFTFGSEITLCRALEEKCEIRSCSYLVNRALTSEE